MVSWWKMQCDEQEKASEEFAHEPVKTHAALAK